MIKFIQDNSKYFTYGGVFALLVICYFQQKENAKLRVDTRVKQTVIDSLNGEIFVKDIDLGRYEVMWNRITEMHPSSAEQVEHEVE